MNKLGVHAFVWEKGGSREECTRAVARTAEVGYDLIEVSAMDMAQIDPAHTRAELAKAGIGATFSFGLDDGCDISSNDPDKTERGEAKLNQAVRLAADMGATHVCGILYSGFQKYAVPPTADGIGRAVEVLQRVADVDRPGRIVGQAGPAQDEVHQRLRRGGFARPACGLRARP